MLKRLILKNNLIFEFIDSQDNHKINYEYNGGLLEKEIRYNLRSNSLISERKYSYDDIDLFDYHDIMLHERYITYFENRVVAEFFKLNQKFRRYREVDIVLSTINGEERLKYRYAYLTNDRNLVTHKIIEEANTQFKDTVSYVYTCKY